MSDWEPLGEITVLDLSAQLPGPFATLLLRALGARVVKIEPPIGDVGRLVDPPMFRRVNAGKDILVLDLKSDAGRAELHALVAEADVLIEGFRPGVTTRLAADWETLSAINPRLVYCSLSGFGASGPLTAQPGHDLNFLALSGGLPAGLPDGDALIRVPWVDLASATNAALLIVAALHDRARTGRGRRFELALLDAAAVWSNTKLPRPGSEGAYGVFMTADDRRVAVSVLEDAMWQRLCQAFGWDDWLADAALAENDERRERSDEILMRVREAIAARTAAELDEVAVAHDLPINRISDAGDVHDEPQIASRDLFPGAETWRPLGPSAAALSFADVSTEVPSR